jgi:serine/threonine protein kinase
MSAVEREHPSLEQLAAFNAGRLDPQGQATVESHVAGCDTCCERLRSLPADALAGLVRVAGAAGPGGQDPAETRDAAAPRPPSPSPREVPPGLVGHPRYEVEEVLLGAGGMGTVFKARHRLMNRTVALKVMSPELMHRPAAVERFQREVRAAAQLAHPNIVTSFDAEQAGDCHFLVMEFIEGTSLAQRVAEQGQLAVVQACNYARQAALALEHAHERDMVHRDIKPHNLMLTAQDQVKVLDFGLARFLSESAPVEGAAAPGAAPLAGTWALDMPQDGMADASGSGSVAGDGSQSAAEPGDEPLTRLGAVMGSPDTIAPEQIADAHAADIRADIYSLGCTLYHLLAGQPPFPGSVLEKLHGHAAQQPRPLTDLRPDLPAGLAAVLDRMLAKDPARRYQTPADVADALAPFAVPPIRR